MRTIAIEFIATFIFVGYVGYVLYIFRNGQIDNKGSLRDDEPAIPRAAKTSKSAGAKTITATVIGANLCVDNIVRRSML